jgi:hypothetical protein
MMTLIRPKIFHQNFVSESIVSVKDFFTETKRGLKVEEGLWLSLRRKSARAARQSGGLLRNAQGDP